jgi:hypothetical protein
MIYTIEAFPVGTSCPYTPGQEVINPQSSYNWDSKPITQPKTYEERVTQSKQFIKEVQIVTPLLIDDVDNAIWCTYGPASNIAYLLDIDGKVLFKQIYYDPTTMEKPIQDLLKTKSK